MGIALGPVIVIIRNYGIKLPKHSLKLYNLRNLRPKTGIPPCLYKIKQRELYIPKFSKLIL